nr:immunoglobulin light chain junction region [Macaca mulatta]MOV75075.1 immunoglobulin light chain junction region [Macaca mulatta]MOV75275.1 immunoglobulin light chain junction region [Macaca mulatta]MOV76224.1 immunoglobulin light chain junction region [Macaca mulatta]MOV76919.1 immunoglobulin light chain junction region [Macaca mulatta]
CQQYHNLPWTF